MNSRWNGGIEWQTEWLNDGNGGNGRMAERMADGRIADYNNNLRKIGTADGMAEWQKEWQNGRMAGMATYVLFMVHADDDTLIFYSIEDVTTKKFVGDLPRF
jgi:hypothetical protein